MMLGGAASWCCHRSGCDAYRHPRSGAHGAEAGAASITTFRAARRVRFPSHLWLRMPPSSPSRSRRTDANSKRYAHSFNPFRAEATIKPFFDRNIRFKRRRARWMLSTENGTRVDGAATGQRDAGMPEPRQQQRTAPAPSPAFASRYHKRFPSRRWRRIDGGAMRRPVHNGPMKHDDAEHVLDIGHGRQVRQLQRMGTEQCRRNLWQGGIFGAGNRHSACNPFPPDIRSPVHDMKPVKERRRSRRHPLCLAQDYSFILRQRQ